MSCRNPTKAHIFLTPLYYHCVIPTFFSPLMAKRCKIQHNEAKVPYYAVTVKYTNDLHQDQKVAGSIPDGVIGIFH